MRFDPHRGVLCRFSFHCTLPPAFAQTPYDGNWHVTIMTKTGTCEPTASSMLTVADGKITAPGANVSGTIGQWGTCESFDQWCICQRSTQRQRRIGEVEWSICRHTVQRAVGSIAPISQLGTSLLNRRLLMAAAVLFVTAVASSESKAQSGPFASLAGSWSGGGTVTLDDGSTERIRCRARYAPVGPTMEMSLTCASDAYKFNLGGQRRRPRAAPSLAHGARPAATSRLASGPRERRKLRRWSPQRAASTPTSR